MEKTQKLKYFKTVESYEWVRNNYHDELHTFNFYIIPTAEQVKNEDEVQYIFYLVKEQIYLVITNERFIQKLQADGRA